MERVFNVLAGVRKEDDTLPRRFTEEPLPEESGLSAGSVLELDVMLDEYYSERGWDIESGIPTKKKLRELGLDQYISILEADGITVKEA